MNAIQFQRFFPEHPRFCVSAIIPRASTLLYFSDHFLSIDAFRSWWSFLGFQRNPAGAIRDGTEFTRHRVAGLPAAHLREAQ
jgi:hypothetical protein